MKLIHKLDFLFIETNLFAKKRYIKISNNRIAIVENEE